MKNKMRDRIHSLYEFCKDNITRSIRLEIMATFLICLLSSLAIGNWYDMFYRNNKGSSVIDYKSGIDAIKNDSSNIKEAIAGQQIKVDESQKINNIIKENTENNETVKILITDLNGKVLYSSSDSADKTVDIFDAIKKEKEFNQKYDNNIVLMKDSRGNTRILILNKLLEYTEVSTVSFSDSKSYMIVTGTPEGSLTYMKDDLSSFTTGVLQIIVFIILFYIITNSKMDYLVTISKCLIQIAKGNLDYRLKIQGKDELAALSGNINFMAGELKDRIEKQTYAENTKNELITNVSHDLRTPLTSIKGYIGLLKDKKYKSQDELSAYLNIVYNKSEQLEKLINDLFEYTKLVNRNISLNKEKILFNELLEQLAEELYVISCENHVEIKCSIPNEKIYCSVDSKKMVRVFENLLMNAIRYADKNTAINLTLKRENDNAVVTVENKCENFNKNDIEKIFDRFYRTDKSRAESDKGSGLGLSIAKSIVELHEGRIWAEYENQTIIFCVIIKAL